MNRTSLFPALNIGLCTLCALCALCMNTGCSTAGRSPVPGPAEASRPTSFEITYSLGEHGQHRLVGYSGGASMEPRMASYLERAVIDEQAIQPESYDQYFAKVMAFTQRAQRAPSQNRECRSPYSITLKINGKTYSSKGCRSQSDDGSFGKLVREGEFLLYSKK